MAGSGVIGAPRTILPQGTDMATLTRVQLWRMVHEPRHHPSDYPDIDPDRRDSDLAAQPQLGLRSGGIIGVILIILLILLLMGRI